MKFALDTPVDRELHGLTRFSGWCLTDSGLPVDQLFLRVNGTAVLQLERLPRRDLVGAFPEFPQAAQGGFAGDLPLPGWSGKGDRLDVEIVARLDRVEHSLLRRSFKVHSNEKTLPTRLRSYDLADFLERTPGSDIWGSGPHALVAGTTPSWPATVLDTPHFHEPGAIPTLRVLEDGPTNSYSQNAFELMDQTPAPQVFLDLGCGIRRLQDMRSNGIYLDAVHFRGVDVVSTCSRLPLRDNSVDAVISLSVFEHLPDPFAMAAEIRRVLKPGGTVWIETAFMQPLHADPSHYFNMTLEGLLQTFAAFDIEEKGVLPHHFPSWSLRMQLDHVLPYMQDSEWRRTLEVWRAKLQSDGAALDNALGPIGRNTLAAGVFIRGRKPATL